MFSKGEEIITQAKEKRPVPACDCDRGFMKLSTSLLLFCLLKSSTSFSQKKEKKKQHLIFDTLREISPVLKNKKNLLF